MSRKLIEAALFMSSRPMSAEEISKITGVAPGNVEKILGALSSEYAGEGKGVEIIRIPEGWEMRVRPELLPKVAHLTPYSDLRDGHKRTLALVAYREPLKQSEVVHIQGNKAYKYIKFLRKKGLIKSEKDGRTVKLMLTKEFERYFGLEKERIKEMLQKGLDRAKAREEAKAQKAEAKEGAVKPLTDFAARPEARSVAQDSAKTPPTNVQYIEVSPSGRAAARTKDRPAAAEKTAGEGRSVTRPEIKAPVPEAKLEKPAAIVAIKPLKGKPRKRAKKLPPAAKIGTRRPSAGAL